MTEAPQSALRPRRERLWPVVAYNYFVSRIRVLDSEMTNFSNDFLNIVRRHFFS